MTVFGVCLPHGIHDVHVGARRVVALHRGDGDGRLRDVAQGLRRV